MKYTAIFFEQLRKLNLNFTEKDGVISIPFNSEKFDLTTYILIGDDFLTSFAKFPTTITESNLSKAYELVNGINNTLPFGNLEVASFGGKKNIVAKYGVRYIKEIDLAIVKEIAFFPAYLLEEHFDTIIGVCYPI